MVRSSSKRAPLALGIRRTNRIFSARQCDHVATAAVKDPERLARSRRRCGFPVFEPVILAALRAVLRPWHFLLEICVSGWREMRPFVASATAPVKTDFAELAAVSGKFFSDSRPAGLTPDGILSDDDRPADRTRRGYPVRILAPAFASDPAIVGQVVQIENVPLTSSDTSPVSLVWS